MRPGSVSAVCPGAKIEEAIGHDALRFVRCEALLSAMRKIIPVLVAASWACQAAIPASADDSPLDTAYRTDRYERCVKRIEAKPDDAFEQALIWQDDGGGGAAEHCAALALLALNQPGEAAVRLDKLAREPASGNARNRAVLMGQAGNAWLLAGVADKAEETFAAALALAPEDIDLLVDRARARAMRKNWSGAENDLSHALRIDAKRPEILVLRASARLAQGAKADARSDIDAALAIDPFFPGALVERGSFKLEAGDVRGARGDWTLVLSRAPDSPAADSARARIEQLEVGQGAP